MKVSVAYAKPDQQVWLRLVVPEDSTVNDSIEHSRVLAKYPASDLDKQKVGVFGKFVKRNAALKDGAG